LRAELDKARVEVERLNESLRQIERDQRAGIDRAVALVRVGNRALAQR
jgi:hypothetical protein